MSNNTDFFNAYVLKLKTKLDEVVGHLVVAETKLHLAELAAQASVETASNRDAIINDLRNTIDELNARDAQSQGSLTELRGALEKTRADHAAAMGNADNALRLKTNELNELNAQLASAREEVVALRREVDSLTALDARKNKKAHQAV